VVPCHVDSYELKAEANAELFPIGTWLAVRLGKSLADGFFNASERKPFEKLMATEVHLELNWLAGS
jgi:hypothetical protein